jgi:hypothetical protein
MESIQPTTTNAPAQATIAPDNNFTEWSKDLMVFAILMEQRVYSMEWNG